MIHLRPHFEHVPPLSKLLSVSGSVLSSGFGELRHRPKGQLPALDAFRSAAVLLVVFHHWSIKEYVNAGGVYSPLQEHPIFFFGWTGVDLFFVLSGFLIGKQLWRELDRTGTIQFGRFILRRGLRIWPIYYVMLAGYAAFSSFIHPRVWDWTFLSNYRSGAFTRGWSLSTEEQFYIVVPILLLLLRKRFPLVRYVWVLLGIEAMVLINRYFTIEQILASGRTLASAQIKIVTPFHMHPEGLLAGLIIALFVVTRPHLLQPAESTHGVSWRGLGVFVALSAVGLALRAANGDLFPFLALGMIFGGATYWALLDRSLLSAPLRAGFFYPISRLSYSMYLNHWWIWPSSNKAIVEGVQAFVSNPTAVFLISMFIGTALSFVLAAVMFMLVEHPFLLLRDRVLTSTRKAHTQSAHATSAHTQSAHATSAHA